MRREVVKKGENYSFFFALSFKPPPFTYRHLFFPFSFHFAWIRPTTVINQLGADFMQYVRSLPNIYKASSCSWYLRQFNTTNSLRMELTTAHQTNFQVFTERVREGRRERKGVKQRSGRQQMNRSHFHFFFPLLFSPPLAQTGQDYPRRHELLKFLKVRGKRKKGGRRRENG